MTYPRCFVVNMALELITVGVFFQHKASLDDDKDGCYHNEPNMIQETNQKAYIFNKCPDVTSSYLQE